MHLRDLRKSFTEMEYTDKLNLILSIRASRRVSKKVAAPRAAATRKAATKKPVDVDALLKTMSKEQLMKLLAGC